MKNDHFSAKMEAYLSTTTYKTKATSIDAVLISKYAKLKTVPLMLILPTKTKS
jgi:hypothetical protein